MASLRSNEVESMQKCMDMIGGGYEYQAAVILAAFINTWKDRLSITLERSKDEMRITIWKKGYSVHSIQVKLPRKYEYLFDDPNKTCETCAYYSMHKMGLNMYCHGCLFKSEWEPKEESDGLSDGRGIPDSDACWIDRVTNNRN